MRWFSGWTARRTSANSFGNTVPMKRLASRRTHSFSYGFHAPHAACTRQAPLPLGCMAWTGSLCNMRNSALTFTSCATLNWNTVSVTSIPLGIVIRLSLLETALRICFRTSCRRFSFCKWLHRSVLHELPCVFLFATPCVGNHGAVESNVLNGAALRHEGAAGAMILKRLVATAMR